jgi:hypothetical protein
MSLATYFPLLSATFRWISPGTYFPLDQPCHLLFATFLRRSRIFVSFGFADAFVINYTCITLNTLVKHVCI